MLLTPAARRPPPANRPTVSASERRAYLKQQPGSVVADHESDRERHRWV
jgi:hypothetical protein